MVANKTKKQTKAKKPKNAKQANEAQDVLKQMEAKKQAGDCPFC